MTRLPDPALLAEPRLRRVLDALTAAGHRALIVGGAVRNALLGAPVDDIDIATDARPEQVVDLAAAAGLKPVPTGIAHGTVTVVADGRGFEVTTFRRDVETFGRHATVAFATDLAEDAARRDFTMNALYATPEGEVLDPVGGLPDLAARRVRFVGEPEARIREDYLRILRFFRFHAWYGAPGAADPAALAACAALQEGLDRLSRERVGHELRKLLAAPDPSEAVALMADSGILARILPGGDPRHLPALLEAEAGAAPDPIRRLAVLGGSAEALRLSRAEARRLTVLAAAGPEMSLNEAGYRLGDRLAADAALVAAARGLELPLDWKDRIAHAARARLPVAAADLAPLQGPALGQALRAAEAAWIESGFAMPAPGLIDVGRLAAGDAGGLAAEAR